MENRLQPFDVCIICALPEEVRALLAVIKPQCQDGLEEHTSSRYGYSYRSSLLKNDKGELLTLHISWPPRYGLQEMTLHLSHVLEECRPRIAIMTGICAGDSQQVHLGDLVVAERTFTYDNGKYELDKQGRSVHLHDTLTYQLDANILQFLGLFDDWKPLVAQLEGPPSMPDQYKTACHIKAMASGSAVRADKPFQDVKAPVRGTVAIDMEGAAVGLVTSHHPLTRWLIVKGVCDYADQTKNDSYHDYAARASASYALSFIQAYVTNERLPRLGALPPSIRDGAPRVRNVPSQQNPHLTGRDELVDQPHHQQLIAAWQNSDTKTCRTADSNIDSRFGSDLTTNKRINLQKLREAMSHYSLDEYYLLAIDLGLDMADRKLPAEGDNPQFIAQSFIETCRNEGVLDTLISRVLFEHPELANELKN